MNQRLYIEVASAALDRMREGGRRFFTRHCGRSHRVRHTGRAEFEAAERAGCELGPPLPGFRCFTAVRQVAPSA